MNGRLVLVVVVDPVLQRHVSTLLRELAYEPLLTSTVDEAIGALVRDSFLATILDLNDGGGDACEFFRRLDLHGGNPGAVIGLSDTGELQDSELGFLRLDDIVTSGVKVEELAAAIKEALARPRRSWGPIREDDARLRQEMALCCSTRMEEVWDIVRQAAGVDVTVLICGETGTGKDVVARAIHHLSSRRGQPFVKVNCAAVPRELLESELFGHERGAFTGAHQLKIGKFESADRGTMFLDEIGDLHPALQAKLLHVLQDGSFSRVGGRSSIKVDVRVLAATNQDLERAVLTERFREDLYYRLNVVQVTVPPLRERAQEIPLLVDYFVDRYARLFRRPGIRPAASAMEGLLRHRYPGNVRELENIIKRMIVLNDPLLVRSSLRAPGGKNGHNGESLAEPHEEVSLKQIARTAARAAERDAIARVLHQTNWNRVKAAKLLKISYRALLYKIRYVGLDRQAQLPRSPVST